ncbi:NAD-dependent epimerase/dehydratase family protein [Granulicella cerasi]|uniref:NAD-dependent epimerase/dehydratase family protein n=1 Tax=Granulicella cerasi TaxID=741063 RepID=A0ABW1Z887_9BACT
MPTRPIPNEDLAHVLEHARPAFEALRDAKIFIAGGTGFFGRTLVESLLHANRTLSLGITATLLTRDAQSFAASAPHIAEDHAIKLLQGDLAECELPSMDFTHVLHAAADSAGKQALVSEVALAESIVAGTRNLLRQLRAQSVRLLYLSSGAVYGRSCSENFLDEDTPLLDAHATAANYDEAKVLAEELCLAASRNAGFDVVIARCFAFVGPYLPLDQHFALGNFIDDALQHRPIHIRGDGSPGEHGCTRRTLLSGYGRCLCKVARSVSTTWALTKRTAFVRRRRSPLTHCCPASR